MNFRFLLLISDIHIKVNKLHAEYQEVLNNFVGEIKPICDDQTLILVLGDIVDNFVSISNELEIMVSWFLNELDNIGVPVFVIGGNHDMTRGNITKLDTLTPIFKIANFNNVRYLDMELDYKSGIIEYENLIFKVYSIFDNYRNPNTYNKKNKNQKIISLCHAPIIGSKTDIGYSIENGINKDMFENADIVLLGDIHKRQYMFNKHGIPLFYVGSILQHSFGESVNNHGYSLLDLNDISIKNYDIENPYTYYNVVINGLEDIENNEEKFTNIE